jgi:hypothetical protein
LKINTLNLKVQSSNIYIDADDERLALEIELNKLSDMYLLPRWAYLTSEWNEFIIKKVRLERCLRNLQERF